MAFCSAVTLCFASIFSLAAAALLAIAFSTDNWQTISVNREYNAALIKPNVIAKKMNASEEDIKQSPLYYTRTRGLFRECYPGPKDKAPSEGIIDLYMSPVETWCRNINYYIPEDGKTKDFKQEQMTKIHMSRAMIALFIVAFFFMFVSFTTGIVGCWRTSDSNIQASAVLMLLALVEQWDFGMGVNIMNKKKLTMQFVTRQIVRQSCSCRNGHRNCCQIQHSNTTGHT